MKKHMSILCILILTLFLAVSISADTAKYSVDMTIRQIAHDAGLKGRELVELLELAGSVGEVVYSSQLTVHS